MTELIFNLVNIFGSIMDTLIVFVFLNAFLRPKKWPKAFFGAGILGYFVLSTVPVYLGVPAEVMMLLGFVLVVVLSMMYEAGLGKRLFLVLIFAIIMIVSELLVGFTQSAIFGLTVKEMNNNVYNYMIGVLFSKIIAYFIIRLTGKIGHPTDIKMIRPMIIPMLTLPIATFSVIMIFGKYLYVENSVPDPLAITTSLFLVASNILLMYFFEQQLIHDNEKRKMDMLQQHIQNGENFYKNLMAEKSVENKAIHDLKNQMFGLRELCSQDPDAGAERINQICEKLMASNSLLITGIESIDALINAKIGILEEHQIEFRHKIFIPENNKFDMIDMCIMLGNLIDNAIEASSKIVDAGNRFVELNMVQNDSFLTVSVRNRVDGKVNIKNNSVETTKKDKHMHGFGLTTVTEILEKYKGHIDLDQENDVFIARMFLEN